MGNSTIDYTSLKMHWRKKGNNTYCLFFSGHEGYRLAQIMGGKYRLQTTLTRLIALLFWKKTQPIHNIAIHKFRAFKCQVPWAEILTFKWFCQIVVKSTYVKSQDFAEILRSNSISIYLLLSKVNTFFRLLEQFIQTVKDQNNAFLTCSWRLLTRNKLDQL